jgi:hypothetical protein
MIVGFYFKEFFPEVHFPSNHFWFSDTGSAAAGIDLTGTVRASLQELAVKRGRLFIARGQAHRMVELFGGNLIPMFEFEPDPTTFREKYYYNTKLNVLYAKAQAGPTKVWKVSSHD